MIRIVSYCFTIEKIELDKTFAHRCRHAVLAKYNENFINFPEVNSTEMTQPMVKLSATESLKLKCEREKKYS